MSCITTVLSAVVIVAYGLRGVRAPRLHGIMAETNFGSDRTYASAIITFRLPDFRVENGHELDLPLSVALGENRCAILLGPQHREAFQFMPFQQGRGIIQLSVGEVRR